MQFIPRIAEGIKTLCFAHPRPVCLTASEVASTSGVPSSTCEEIGERFVPELWDALGGEKKWGDTLEYREGKFYVW